MGDRKEIHSNQRALILTAAAAGLETLFCAWLLLRIPSDSKNSFLFGLSKERLLMAALFSIFFLGNILIFLFRQKINSAVFSKDRTLPALQIVSLLSAFFVLMPDYRFGKFAAYFTRVWPFLLWLFLTASTFALYCHYQKNRFLSVRETIANIGKGKKYILPVLAVLLFGILFVEITGLGKTVESALWNKNGIPLQSIQLFSAVIVFIFLRKIGLFEFFARHPRIPHFLLIWVISAVIWSLAPLAPHFFAPGPYEPNLQYYPYSDAITYDMSAQTALKGWGFNHERTVLKPTVAYTSFLTHLVTGNDYNRSMMLQSALFAILPAIIFLFGSAIGGTGCGYLAAAFSLLKEWNALNTHEILTIHSRLTMSEFIIQIFFAAFCYAIFRWLKKDGRESYYAAIAGGSLALGMFTRYNFAAFVPASLLILAIAYRKQFRAFRKPLLIFLFTMILTAAPMVYRSSQTSKSVFSELNRVVNKVLIKQRFNSAEDRKATPTPSIETDDLHSDSDISGDISQNASDSENSLPASGTGEAEINTGQITQELSNINSIKNLPLIPSMINHGLHNFISSALTLPMEPVFENLEHLYKNEGDGLWKDSWQGEFTFGQWIVIAFWVITGAAALGWLIKLHGIAAFSIPYFWLVYAFSIGFSRSSGGRYIVPCNWIPMLLLAFLCVLIMQKGIPSVETAERIKTVSTKKTAAVIISFAAIFTSLLLFEKIMPAQITAVPEGDFAVLQERLSDVKEIDWELVKEQNAQGIMHITHGYTLYPRFYYFRVGEHSTGALAWKDYSRMVFTGINREAKSGRLMQDYMLPYQKYIGDFPQDSIYRAISCKSENGYEDVLAITIETPEGEIFTYVRDPLPAFSCPVPEPVCISIDNCR